MERLLDNHEVAKLLGVAPRKVAGIMKARGVFPINISSGKRATYRWLEAAVSAALVNMHENAQIGRHKNKSKTKINQQKMPEKHVRDMSNESLFEYIEQLTQRNVMQ